MTDNAEDDLARDMKNDDWRATHQDIAFNELGELIDGQHRLLVVTTTEGEPER